MKSSVNSLTYDNEKLTHFIQSQTKIRLMIDDTGNYGNQAATYNLILRIHQMGFTGEFEVIYFKETKEKIQKLFHIPPSEEDSFYSHDLKIKFIVLNEFLQHPKKIGSTTLGMTGAIDKNPCSWNLDINNDNFADILNVDIFIRFSPYYNLFNLCDTQIYQRNHANHTVQNNTCEKMLITPVSTFKEAKAFLHDTKSGTCIANEHPNLASLFSHIENHSINFQAAYGWTLRDSPSNLLNIILGSRYAQIHGEEELKKPLLIGTFFSLDNHNSFLFDNKIEVNNLDLLMNLIYQDNWGQYETVSGVKKIQESIKNLNLRDHFKVVDLTKCNLEDFIKQLKPQDIVLIRIPPLPKILFDGLFSHSDFNIFPPVREGASSFTSLLSTGKPHLHCRSEWDWEINLEFASEDLREELTQLNNLICRELYGQPLDFTAWQHNSVDEILGKFIINSLNENSDVSKYFNQLKEDTLKPENDRIANDLFTSIHLLEKMNNMFDAFLDVAKNYAVSVVEECPSYFNPVVPYGKSNSYSNCHSTLFSSPHNGNALPTSNISQIGCQPR